MAEKKLIDANGLIRDINADIYRTESEKSYDRCLVYRQPTVDAVPVVRCRDCKHRGTDYCIFHIKGEPADEELLRKLDNDFCSYGERKDGDGNGR